MKTIIDITKTIDKTKILTKKPNEYVKRKFDMVKIKFIIDSTIRPSKNEMTVFLRLISDFNQSILLYFIFMKQTQIEMIIIPIMTGIILIILIESSILF